MNDTDQINKIIEAKKGIWRQLNILIWIYGASIVIPAVAAMVASMHINDDLKDLGYVITINDNHEENLKWTKYLLPGKALYCSCDIIKDAYKLHSDEEYQSQFIQAALEKGKIKAMRVNKH